MEQRIIRRKFQITIPRWFRRSLGLYIGQTLTFFPGPENMIVIVPGSWPEPYGKDIFEKITGADLRRRREKDKNR